MAFGRLQPLKDLGAQLDYNISRSTFGRVFRLHGSGHEKERKNALFFTEIWAGLTTFFTMAYIISTNASIVKDTGGVCICTSTSDPTCVSDAAYSACQIDFTRDLITATAAITGVTSILFGLFTNLPIALAPGMGMNAYFTYQVVGYHGTGPVPYRLALTAVFIEGLIFFFLSVVGMRQWLVKVIPGSMKTASGAGIGLFLTLTGLSRSAGIGIVTSGGTAQPIELAGCPDAYYNLTTGVCDSHKMTNPAMWIGIMCGGVLTTYLMAFRFRLAIIIGILVVSIFSWPRNSSFTYFPHTADGDSKFEFFKKVVTFHPITSILGAQDWKISASSSQFALALFTLLYVDIIDTTATLYSMARFAGVVDSESGDFPRSTIAYCTDALCISIGSLFGLSPVSAFVESGAGISEGGKTGLTAITTGICFLLSIFFAPIFASVPPWATGCTLVLVGCMMMRQVSSINWGYVGDAVPAFVTLALMPLTYSVAYGLIAGLFTYTALNGLIYLTKIISGGRFTPPDFELAEYWTINPKGGKAPWFMRALKNGGKFLDDEDRRDDRSEDPREDVMDVEDHRRTDSKLGLKENAFPLSRQERAAEIGLYNL